MIVFRTIIINNFGPFQSAVIPLESRGLILVKGDNRDTTSADSNGSGKSHIFKAMAWGLYGDTIEGDRGREVIRQGAANCTVEIVFCVSNTEYTIKRGRSNGPSLSFFREEADITGPVIKDTQEAINKAVGIDFDTFRNTVLYGQEDTNRFGDVRTTDGERKSVLKRILRMDIIDKALVNVREKNKILADKINRSAESHERLQAKLQEYNERTSTIDPEIKRLRNRAADMWEGIDDKERWQTAQAYYQKEVDGYEGVLREWSSCLHRRNLATVKVTELQGSIRNLMDKRDSSRSSMEIMKGATCPTCGAKQSQTRVLQHVQLHQGIVTHSQSQIDILQATIEGKQDEINELNEREQALRHRKDTFSESRAFLDQINKAISKIESQEAVYEEIQNEIKSRLLEKSNIRHLIASTTQEATKLWTSLQSAKEEQQHMEFWTRGFGNQGLPSYLMSEILPELASRTNHYLKILSDGDISIQYEAESTLKSGEIRDKLALLMTVEGQQGVRPSTGQMKKITIASDLALMDILAMREGSAIDLLMLDEILDGLDQSGKARVIDLLQELRQHKGTIMVISHDPSLAELFENTITVVKEQGIARIE